jgi:hypothetical protein
LNPKNTRILFFYQDDPARPDLYADSYAYQFRRQVDALGMEFFVSSLQGGVGSKAGINLHRLPDKTAKQNIQQILSDFKQSQAAGQGKNIVSVLVSASRSKDQRNKVTAIFDFVEKNSEDGFLIAGANTLFSDDYGGRLCCNRFVAAITFRPIGKKGETRVDTTIAGASYDATGLLLQAMTSISIQGKEVNRESLATAMKSGSITIQSNSPVAAKFEMQERERSPRRGWVVTPSGTAKKWSELEGR